MNLTNYAIANLKLTTPQMNLLAKLDKMGVVVDFNGEASFVTNPHTGFISTALDPLVGTLINWVYQVYATYGNTGKMTYRGTKVAVGTFDRVRYLILAVDKQAFADFID